MLISLAPSRARALLIGLVAISVAAISLAIASVAEARTIYFRDGLGASAKVTYNVVGQRVDFTGTLWDKPGDGYHARIYGYTNGERFGIRKATGGAARNFRKSSPVKTYFKVCTYDRNVMLKCTTRFTDK